MSKYRGSNFNDYLKERSISEEVSALAEKRWEVLCTEVSLAPEDTTEALDDSPSPIRSNPYRCAPQRSSDPMPRPSDIRAVPHQSVLDYQTSLPADSAIAGDQQVGPSPRSWNRMGSERFEIGISSLACALRKKGGTCINFSSS